MPATRTMTSTRAPARATPRFGSRDDKRCLSRLERGPDLFQADAGAVSLAVAERMMAEPCELEQPGQPFYRGARKGQASERREHELLGRLPGRAGHPGPRGDAFEPPVAFDDRHSGIGLARQVDEDRKSTRLNSSHLVISYAVFCLKKKKK